MCNSISGVTHPIQLLLALDRLLHVIIFLIYFCGRWESQGDGLCELQGDKSLQPVLEPRLCLSRDVTDTGRELHSFADIHLQKEQVSHTCAPAPVLSQHLTVLKHVRNISLPMIVTLV